MGTIERMARAICKAAGMHVSKVYCPMCEDGECTLWKQCRDEARAALKAYKESQGSK